MSTQDSLWVLLQLEWTASWQSGKFWKKIAGKGEGKGGEGVAEGEKRIRRKGILVNIESLPKKDLNYFQWMIVSF